VREINFMPTRLCCGSCGDAGIGSVSSAILNQTLAGVTDILGDELEELLGWVRPEARVTVGGPSVGMLPDAFLARGVDLLGLVHITNPDAFLDLLAEGGAAPGNRPRRSCSPAVLRQQGSRSLRPSLRGGVRPRLAPLRKGQRAGSNRP